MHKFDAYFLKYMWSSTKSDNDSTGFHKWCVSVHNYFEDSLSHTHTHTLLNIHFVCVCVCRMLNPITTRLLPRHIAVSCVVLALESTNPSSSGVHLPLPTELLSTFDVLPGTVEGLWSLISPQAHITPASKSLKRVSSSRVFFFNIYYSRLLQMYYKYCWTFICMNRTLHWLIQLD